MADDKFSRTVRIDLMPEGESISPLVSSDLLAKTGLGTRRRQAAMAAASTHSRYEELLESVYDAAVIASPSGKIIEVNGRAVEFFGYERDQLCAMSMVEVIDGADETVMRNIADTLLNERFALLQAFCRRQDGSFFPAEIAVNRLSMDNVRLCFFIRDVTLRHQTEELLRTEHTAVQTCASGIAICDLEGAISYLNPALETMLGRDAAALDGVDIREVLGGAEVAGSLIESAVGNEETWMVECELETAQGEALYAQISATCSRTADGTPSGIVFSVADITLHKQAEEASEAAHADLEARVKARTMDMLEQNDRLQARIAELEAELAKVKGTE